MKAIAVLLLSVASCATAARPQAPPTPKIAPAIASLDFYVGTWDCKGTNDETKQQWNAEVRVAPELDGTWLSVQMIGPDNNRTIEHKGFDPVTKHFVHVAVGIEGSWTTLQSPGWDGTHMVYTPDDKTDHTRATFTKIDETHYSHAVSKETGEPVWEKVCTKQS